MGASRDAYKILQIDSSALPEVVEAAYRALARLRHPDLSERSDASSAMTELNWAYHTLRDPERRIAYDQSRTGAIAVSAPVSAPMTSFRERVEATRPGGTQGVNPEGRIVLDFGRYKGMSLVEIARVDPEYLEWLKRRPLAARYRPQIEELITRLHARYAEARDSTD
jgi:curved DNA-binding protein CbpA